MDGETDSQAAGAVDITSLHPIELTEKEGHTAALLPSQVTVPAMSAVPTQKLPGPHPPMQPPGYWEHVAPMIPMHWPRWQTALGAQDVRSGTLPHSHVPATHCACACGSGILLLHVIPQPPQLPSLAGFTQAPLQLMVPAGHTHPPPLQTRGVQVLLGTSMLQPLASFEHVMSVLLFEHTLAVEPVAQSGSVLQLHPAVPAGPVQLWFTGQVTGVP